jgi:hypothetical protein
MGPLRKYMKITTTRKLPYIKKTSFNKKLLAGEESNFVRAMPDIKKQMPKNGPIYERVIMKRKRTSLSTIIDFDTAEALRNYVYWKPGETISNVVQSLIKEFLDSQGSIDQRPSDSQQGIGKKLL